MQFQSSKNFETWRIPDHLLVRILKKMSLSEGARMRQTCRFVNSFVKESRIIFSPSRDFEISLEIVPRTAEHNWSLTLNTAHLITIPYCYKRQSSVEITNPIDHLGCIFFDKIILRGDSIDETRIVWLKSLNLKCRTLIVTDIKCTQFPQICSAISFSSFCNGSPQPLYDVIDIFPRSKCAEIDTEVSAMPSDGLDLQRFRHLECLRIYQRSPNWVKEFSNFLQHIRLTSSGCLKILAIDVSPPKPTEDYDIFYWPHCHFVWEGEVNQTASEQKAQHVQITLMETPRNTAVIITYNITKQLAAWCNTCQEIRFVEKNNCEEIVFAIFSRLCEHQPLDMSHIVKHLSDSSPEEFPSILCHYLKLKQPYLP